MEEIMKVLRTDPELQEMRKQWSEKFDIPFPLWHFTTYASIDQYKNEIRQKLD